MYQSVTADQGIAINSTVGIALTLETVCAFFIS